MKLHRIALAPAVVGALIGGAILGAPGSAFADEMVQESAVKVICINGDCQTQGDGLSPADATADAGWWSNAWSGGWDEGRYEPYGYGGDYGWSEWSDMEDAFISFGNQKVITINNFNFSFWGDPSWYGYDWAKFAQDVTQTNVATQIGIASPSNNSNVASLTIAIGGDATSDISVAQAAAASVDQDQDVDQTNVAVQSADIDIDSEAPHKKYKGYGSWQ